MRYVVALFVAGLLALVFVPKIASEDTEVLPLYNIHTICNHGNRVYAVPGFGSTITIAVVKGCE
jgi:hypothetical protein